MTSQLLNNRYQLQLQISSKAGRQTYRALDTLTQAVVIVKLLLFESAFKWESLRLFEREIEVLKSLDYPTIPKYLDSFDVETVDGKGFGLVQTYIEAKSLEEHLSQGRVFSENEVLQIAESLLETLSHIHGKNPSVIHRDIKPSNVLLGDRSGDYVGDVYLIDFGAVQTIDVRGKHTMTVVGTYGYMPPEQFGGRSSPASDLYSLGATLLYLITGNDPAEMMNNDLELEFGDVSNISQKLENWLRKMLKAIPSQRFKSAADSMDALFAEEVVRSDATQSSFLEKSEDLQSGSLQTQSLRNFEIRLLPHQLFIRKIDRSAQEAGNTGKLICAVAIIMIYFKFFDLVFPLIIVLALLSVSVRLLSIIFRSFESINGAEILLMKSEINETNFILNSSNRKTDRKVLTRDITCVEVVRSSDDTNFEINIWVGQIYYKIADLEGDDSVKLAETIADWFDVPLYSRFSEGL